MIRKEEFFGKSFETFKKDAEAIIRNLETCEYTMELDESNDPLEKILEISENNPHEYLNQCSFFQFFSRIYQLPYVKKIMQYAEEQGFSLYGPEEMKEKVSMEHFVEKILPKKKEGSFTYISCFDLMFIKKTSSKKVSSSDLRKISLLEQKGEKFIVRNAQDLYREIMSIESKK